jgi:F-box interacting protein
MEQLSDDVATEILSRLPAKDLMSLKSTGKRWNSLINDPSFLFLLSQRPEVVSGLFVQETIAGFDLDFDSANYISVGKGEPVVRDTILDFLPEKVVLLGTCNGLLCCRTCIHGLCHDFKRNPKICGGSWKKENCRKKLVIYICNPATKEWISLSPEGFRVGDAFGFAFNPSGSTSNSSPNFKLVSILRSDVAPKSHSFVIFSSETQKWRISSEICTCDSSIYPNKMVFVNGRFHWLTLDHHIIIFHVDQELSQVMKLPGYTPADDYKCSLDICVGESEGFFHYICAFQLELQVWMLKDYKKPSWVVKHSLPLLKFVDKCVDVFDARLSIPRNALNKFFMLLAFHDEVLFMMTGSCVLSYDFRTEELCNHCGVGQLGYHLKNYPDSDSLFCKPCVIALVREEWRHSEERKYPRLNLAQGLKGGTNTRILGSLRKGGRQLSVENECFSS